MKEELEIVVGQTGSRAAITLRVGAVEYDVAYFASLEAQQMFLQALSSQASISIKVPR